jgi:hypothetical protein
MRLKYYRNGVALYTSKKMKHVGFYMLFGMSMLMTLSKLCPLLHIPGMSLAKDIERVVWFLHTVGMSHILHIKQVI